jgi:hypothetical protein
VRHSPTVLSRVRTWSRAMDDRDRRELRRLEPQGAILGVLGCVWVLLTLVLSPWLLGLSWSILRGSWTRLFDLFGF